MTSLLSLVGEDQGREARMSTTTRIPYPVSMVGQHNAKYTVRKACLQENGLL